MHGQSWMAALVFMVTNDAWLIFSRFIDRGMVVTNEKSRQDHPRSPWAMRSGGNHNSAVG